jgi:hypothetical protein
MQLTERDREIIRLVHRHRFLRSPHILALIPGSPQQTLRRLQVLYQHGYLERPRQQIEYYHRGVPRHIVYGVGDKGATLLRQESGDSFSELRLGQKNRSVGRVYLEHALLVSDFMVALELCCRKSGHVRLLTENELTLSGNEKFKWNVKTNAGLKLGVVPDRAFGLEFKNQTGELDRAYFFLEADRGTMPVIRQGLSQTSFFRKMLAYEATWAQSIHRKRFGFHRFRVITVTTSPERVKSLINACSQLERGHGLFLFAERSILQKPEVLFSAIWQTVKGEAASLLD